MNYHVYVIYSQSLDSFYVGYTENVQERIKQHNTEFYVGSYTKQASDWELFYSIVCKTKKQAIYIESHIKRMKSRKYYFSLKQYPDISVKLLQRYSENI